MTVRPDQLRRALGVDRAAADRLAVLLSKPVSSRYQAMAVLEAMADIVGTASVEKVDGAVYLDVGDASSPTLVWEEGTGRFLLTDLGSWFDERAEYGPLSRSAAVTSKAVWAAICASRRR